MADICNDIGCEQGEVKKIDDWNFKIFIPEDITSDSLIVRDIVGSYRFKAGSIKFENGDTSIIVMKKKYR